MKKLIILSVSVALGLTFVSSCASKLNVTPPNNIYDEQIMKMLETGTDAEKQQILEQIAAGPQQYFNYWNIPNVGTGALAPSTYCMQGIEWMRGLQSNDIAIGRNTETNSLCGKAFYENTFGFSNANESTNKAHWYVNALIINKANFMLGYMNEELAAKDPKMAAARAAALMIRGYGYMCLMEEYTQPYASMADPNTELGMSIYTNYDPGQAPVARSSAAATWAFIKKDLQEAVTLATSSVGFTVGWDKSEDLDAGVANFLLARACMLSNDWSGTIAACDAIINSGKYSFIKQANWGGHNESTSWDAESIEILPEKNAFTAINVNPECILGYNVLSSYNPNSESNLCAHFTRLANPFGYYASSTCARIDDRLYNKIDDNDFRKAGWYPEEIKDWRYLGTKGKPETGTKGIVASYGALKFAATCGLNLTDGKGHTTGDLVGNNEFTKFRYSEVVLMKAIAQAMNGGDAKSTLNTLLAARTSSGNTALTCDTYPSMQGMSVKEMVQFQFRVEMWGENGRAYYMDKFWGINTDRTGSTVHISGNALNAKISWEEKTCKIIEEEQQNNPNWNTLLVEEK